MFKDKARELYSKAKAQKEQAMAGMQDLEAMGREYHDWCAVVNIFDELAAQLYTVKTTARLNLKVKLARRMARLIGDKEIRAAVLQELDKYELN